jgi:hypothetical protein
LFGTSTTIVKQSLVVVQENNWHDGTCLIRLEKNIYTVLLHTAQPLTMSIVPANARFQSGGKAVAISSSRRTVKVMPEGGTSGYTPDTNGVIRIELSPSLQFLDPHMSYLSFRIKPKANTIDLGKECRMDKNSMSWCKTFTITSSTGATIEHIDHYNLLTNLMHKVTSPEDYRTSIGQMVDNSGDRAVRNAAMATPGGKMYNSGFDMSGILSGGGDNGRLLPLGFMQGPLTLELTLAPFKECFIGTKLATATAAEYQIDNVEYHAQCVSFSPEYNAKFSQQLRDRGIDMSFSTYKTHSTVLTSNTEDLSISQNSASVKGVYHVLRSKNKHQSDKHDSLSTYKSGNIEEVQWDMGSKLFPEFPLKMPNDGVIDLYSNNLQSFNMWRNHALGSSVDDKNFMTFEPTTRAGGLHGTAFSATPVRRVYGTWVCNGKEIYDKTKYTNTTAAVAGNYDVVTINAAINALTLPTVKMALANTKKNPLTKVGLANANTVEFTHTVPTLSFVPDKAKDISLIESGMRCKIGCSLAEIPEDEGTANANVDIQSSRAADVGSADYTNLTATNLGLDRFFLATPAVAYTAHANAVASKNTNHEHDSKNIMYAGSATHVAWAHTASGAGGVGAMAARQVVGVGVPFVDGSNRPILSKRVGTAFKGWVEILPDDSSFFLGCNFETHPESSQLVSGSDLTNATPLHLRLTYQNSGGVDQAGNTAQTGFYEKRDNSDPFTSFVHIDAVLRLQEDGTVVSSV